MAARNRGNRAASGQVVIRQPAPVIARQVTDGSATSGNTKCTRKPVMVQPTASQLKPDQYQYRPSFVDSSAMSIPLRLQKR
ncbi:hypothetical protein AB0L13_34195 [Saccharopolyspora shandongensis]|uniref:hypothetical protein n=1 Tax=Saccharopolyspora shandongensis TaxID=418495 RepID=UPI0034387329